MNPATTGRVPVPTSIRSARCRARSHSSSNVCRTSPPRRGRVASTVVCKAEGRRDAVSVAERATVDARGGPASPSSRAEPEPEFIWSDPSRGEKSGLTATVPLAATALTAGACLQAAGDEALEGALLEAETYYAGLGAALALGGLLAACWRSRAALFAAYLSAQLGIPVTIDALQIYKEGVVLRDVSIGRTEALKVRAVVVRGGLPEVWAAVRAVVERRALQLGQVHVLGLRASTTRHHLTALLRAAQAVGFEVSELRLSDAEVQILAPGTRHVALTPVVSLQELQLRDINHRMSPAQVVASIQRLKERSVEGAAAGAAAGPARSGSGVLLRVHKRWQSTRRRLRALANGGMQEALLRVVQQTESVPELREGLGAVLQPVLRGLELQAAAQAPDPLAATQRLLARRPFTAPALPPALATLQALPGRLGEGRRVVQELVQQRVLEGLASSEGLQRALVDALQPEAGLLPALAQHAHLLSRLVDERLMQQLVEGGALEWLLMRRELLRKLLESRALELMLSTGVMKVLLSQDRTRLLEEIIQGHSMEVLIDTAVLQDLLGPGQPMEAVAN